MMAVPPVPPVPTEIAGEPLSSTSPPVLAPTAVALPAPKTRLLAVVETLLPTVKSPAVVLMATAPVEETPL